MPQTTYFVKECPTCGRKLQVRVEYLGREMVCNHCGGDFLAGDAQDVFTPTEDDCSDAILLRVDELIDKADNNLRKPNLNLKHAKNSSSKIWLFRYILIDVIN